MAVWRNGIRRGLKNLGSKIHVGSSPTTATKSRYEKAYFKEEEPQCICNPCESQEGRRDPSKVGETKERQEQAG